MADTEMLFSRLFARVRVALTSIGKHGLPIVNLTGLALGKASAITETIHGAVLHGVIGVLSWPKSPDADGTAASGFAVRYGDEVVPVGMVDRRIASAFTPAPTGPAVALAGYNGERVLIESTGSGKITVAIGSSVIVIDGATRNIVLSTAGPTPPPTGPAASITLTPAGVVAITGAPTVPGGGGATGGLTYNGVPLQIP